MAPDSLNPLLDRDYKRDPSMKALKRRGLFESVLRFRVSGGSQNGTGHRKQA